jgi:hypothetical protein
MMLTCQRVCSSIKVPVFVTDTKVGASLHFVMDPVNHPGVLNFSILDV